MQNWSILAKFAKKKSSEIGCFLLIVSWWSFPAHRNFPWNRPIFLRICPWKSFEIWLFSAKILRNRTIFRQIFNLLPQNRPIYPRICPWKSLEILLFFLQNIRSPVNSRICIISLQKEKINTFLLGNDKKLAFLKSIWSLMIQSSTSKVISLKSNVTCKYIQ